MTTFRPPLASEALLTAAAEYLAKVKAGVPAGIDADPLATALNLVAAAQVMPEGLKGSGPLDSKLLPEAVRAYATAIAALYFAFGITGPNRAVIMNLLLNEAINEAHKANGVNAAMDALFGDLLKRGAGRA